MAPEVDGLQEFLDAGVDGPVHVVGVEGQPFAV